MANGSLGEATALTYFINHGYKVFTPFDLHSPFDLVVYKDGTLQRVSVKSSSRFWRNRWRVSVGQSSVKYKDKTSTYIHSNFDKNSCDLLVIYIVPENRLLVLDAKNVPEKNVIAIPKL